MSQHTRRTVLKVGGALLGGIAAGTTAVVAESSERFIVDTRSGDRSDVEAAADEVVHDLEAVDLLVVRGDRDSLADATSDFAADSRLRLEEPERAERAAEESASDEPLYPLQWDKQALDVPAAHEITRGEGTRVAIIDSGVDATHPDLERAVNTELSRNFTGDGHGSGRPAGGYHGTHVAGIVAANDRNEVGVVGTAPGTELVDCRVFGTGPTASFADILAAVVYSAEIGCDAANLSIGAYPVARQALGEFYGRTLNRTMTYANKEGTLLVISAGNDAADLQHDKNLVSLPNEGAQGFPVSATGPIGFGWGEDGLREPAYSPSFYTNYGTNAVALAAPGGDADTETDDAEWYLDLVLSTVSDPVFDDGEYVGSVPDWGWAAGTSMAAPQVAGAAALVKSVNPEFNANQVAARLMQTASVPEEYEKAYYGAGFLDVVAALEK